MTAVPDRDRTAAALEAAIGRLLLLGALVGVASLLVGVGLMVAGGISPTSDSASGFDAGRVGPDIVAGRPEGFLWTGIVILIATPIARVAGELLAFAWQRDTRMAGLAAAILAVVALGVVLGGLSPG